MQNFRIVAQLFAGAGEHQLASLQYQSGFCQRQCQRGELLDQQNADAVLRNDLYCLGEPADDRRRQPEGQFVNQEVARPRDQPLGDHDHLLLAAGQILRRG